MNEIMILGSGAAEGIPAIFCGCAACRKARALGGKDIRKRTSYKLNTRVRIDFGADSVAFDHMYPDLHTEELKHLFITHSHDDHFYPDVLSYRRKWMSVIPDGSHLTLYGNIGVIRNFHEMLWRYEPKGFDGSSLDAYAMDVVRLSGFREIELEDEDMTFHPLRSNHMPWSTEEPNIFAVRTGKKYVLFANDTGYFPEETWDYLKQKGFVFDLVISDCTGMMNDWRDGHMSGKYMLEVRSRLLEQGNITGKTRYIVNHFSHNGGLTHAELEARFNPLGIEVGYDGMRINLD